MVSRSILVSTDTTTVVKSITVGRPVRRVVQASANINSLQGVDTTAKVDGSVLVYNASTDKWTATLDLEQQNINGGSY
jgi:hypothetical protein